MKSYILTGFFLLFFLSLKGQEKNVDVLAFSMDTEWTEDVDLTKPWDHYPRPQMKRDTWTNLNGQWDYAIRPVNLPAPEKFDGKILVPFAVESELSGVKKLVNEENYLWYRTSFNAGDLKSGEKLFLNFGAVDWEAVVFINGKAAGGHKGGYTPFSIDVTSFLIPGDQELVVRVWDPSDKGTQARGKQVQNPQGIWYTPVTGIWQTVWLEKLPESHFKKIQFTPDIDAGQMKVKIFSENLSSGSKMLLKVYDNEQLILEKEQVVSPADEMLGMTLELQDVKLWSPEDPFLYDVELTLLNPAGMVTDEVTSYFGMRKISLGNDHNGYTRIFLNNKPFFQFGLLDQGWWPDGLYTAPTEEAMMYDVQMTLDMGFNMLRKHVKLEPARYYYNCDKMGILVWQDMPNGNYLNDLRIQAWETEDAKRTYASSVQFERELKEMMDYFHSFPSIVVWVPFNEGWGQYDTERITSWVKAYDPGRLVDSPSGWTDRGVGDIIDAHIYPGPGMEAPEEDRASVIGEFGGLGLTLQDHMWWDKKNWGYLTYDDKEEFKQRFQQLIEDLKGLTSFGLSAAIYTQTTDVEGEVNGLLTYDRRVLKVDSLWTRTLFAPLYLPANEKVVVIQDAEMSPSYWRVNQNPDKTGKWIKPGFNDTGWATQTAPFSSYDNNFIPKGSKVKSSAPLQLRRNFVLEKVPEQLDIRYFLDKASMKIYINGKEVVEEEFKGGRKRHYRNYLLKDAEKYLKKGENVLAVEVQGQQKEFSFDLGLYISGLQQEMENASPSWGSN